MQKSTWCTNFTWSADKTHFSWGWECSLINNVVFKKQSNWTSNILIISLTFLLIRKLNNWNEMIKHQQFNISGFFHRMTTQIWNYGFLMDFPGLKKVPPPPPPPASTVSSLSYLFSIRTSLFSPNISHYFWCNIISLYGCLLDCARDLTESSPTDWTLNNK